MASPLVIRQPIPSYGSEDILRQELIHHLLQGDFSVGDRYLSDREISETVKKSRATVRRVLDQLQYEGWIDRKVGVGTFVGSRITMGEKALARSPRKQSSSTTQFAIVNADPNSSYSWGIQDWYTDIIEGFNKAVFHESIVLEHLPSDCRKPGMLADRLQRNPPHVILCVGPPMDHLHVVAESKRFGIPCLMAGIRCPEMGVPSVSDDGYRGAVAAVKYLFERGHRRIAFIQYLAAMTGWWSIDRYKGFREGLKQCGLESDSDPTLWLSPFQPDPENADFERIVDFLERRKSTAVILGCSAVGLMLQRPVLTGRLRIPDDLSLLVFDQAPEVKFWLGGLEPTTVKFPLNEIGRTLADYGKKMIDGESVPLETSIFGNIAAGESVKTI